MDELADYTDHQFETKLQIEIEQLTKNKQAQESPKKIITEILNRKLDNNTLLNSIDSVINKMEINHHTTTPQYLDLVEKTTELKKEISGRVQEQLKEFAEKNPEVKPKEDPENKNDRPSY